MPQAETTGRFTVYMGRDAIEQMTRFAKAQGYKSSAEYARALIEKDMAERGEPIDFGLDTWGRKADTTDAPGEAAPKSKKKTKD